MCSSDLDGTAFEAQVASEKYYGVGAGVEAGVGARYVRVPGAAWYVTTADSAVSGSKRPVDYNSFDAPMVFCTNVRKI